MDPWTRALEEVNEIKNLCKLRTWPKRALGTSELGFQGLNTSMVHILLVSHIGLILTVITNNKKRVRQKEKGKFHSFNKASLQQTPMFQKITIKKKKNTTPKQKQNRSYPGWPTTLAWS